MDLYQIKNKNETNPIRKVTQLVSSLVRKGYLFYNSNTNGKQST